jgi:hypothetical protein
VTSSKYGNFLTTFRILNSEITDVILIGDCFNDELAICKVMSDGLQQARHERHAFFVLLFERPSLRRQCLESGWQSNPIAKDLFVKLPNNPPTTFQLVTLEQ